MIIKTDQNRNMRRKTATGTRGRPARARARPSRNVFRVKQLSGKRRRKKKIDVRRSVSRGKDGPRRGTDTGPRTSPETCSNANNIRCVSPVPSLPFGRPFWLQFWRRRRRRRTIFLIENDLDLYVYARAVAGQFPSRGPSRTPQSFTRHYVHNIFIFFFFSGFFFRFLRGPAPKSLARRRPTSINQTPPSGSPFCLHK